jgi:hypothetical protein
MVRLAPRVSITVVTIAAMTTPSAVRAILTALRNLVVVEHWFAERHAADRGWC